jgi:hypothetical protein
MHSGATPFGLYSGQQGPVLLEEWCVASRRPAARGCGEGMSISHAVSTLSTWLGGRIRHIDDAMMQLGLINWTSLRDAISRNRLGEGSDTQARSAERTGSWW